jgi:mono/diheme cytochrome c family protein
VKKLIPALFFAVMALTACPPADKPADTPPTTPPPAPPTPPTPPPPAAPADPKAEAEQIFATRCSVCHGMSGKGDGAGAAALNPKPRNYTDVAWQDSVKDDYLAKVIVEGGAAVGKSPLMAPNMDLQAKPEVVKELVAKVRSFKGK